MSVWDEVKSIASGAYNSVYNAGAWAFNSGKSITDSVVSFTSGTFSAAGEIEKSVVTLSKTISWMPIIALIAGLIIVGLLVFGGGKGFGIELGGVK